MKRQHRAPIEFNAALMLLVIEIGDRALEQVAASVQHELLNTPETLVFGYSGMPNAWAELCRDVRSPQSGPAGEAWRRELEYRLKLRIRLLHEDERQCATFAANQRMGKAFRDLVEPFRPDEQVLIESSLIVLLDRM